LEFRDISRVSEAITAKRMKTDPYSQRRNCSPLNAFFHRCIDCVDIASRSSARWRQTTVRWKNKSSYTHGCRARAYLALARLSCKCFAISFRSQQWPSLRDVVYRMASFLSILARVNKGDLNKRLRLCVGVPAGPRAHSPRSQMFSCYAD